MNDFFGLKEIVRKRNTNNVINDNNADKSFALDESKFKINTPEAQLAKDIATDFNDLENYAFYLSVIKRLGRDRAFVFWKSVKDEIAEKENDEKYKIRDPKRYFAWRYRERIIP